MAKAATTTIPIVFTTGGDPVKLGLVTSLGRPGGNVTGVTQMTGEVAPKRVELASNPNSETEFKKLQAAASTRGLHLHVLNTSTERDIDTL